MNKLEKEFKNSNKYDVYVLHIVSFKFHLTWDSNMSVKLTIKEVVAANGLLQAFGFVTSLISVASCTRLVQNTAKMKRHAHSHHSPLFLSNNL
ncbi:hypothetical protein K1719_015955 [Acacia pycnantha]|nr:hypothetical protein K1719_015955 [Acacia pycnantha]